MSASPPKEKGPLRPTWVMAAAVTLVLIILCVLVAAFGNDTGSEKTEQKADSVQSEPQGADEPDAGRPAPEPYVRKPVTANAHSGTWTWFDVPSGYHPMICEADESLACTSTETDISAVNFELQCKDLRGNLLDWHAPADLIGCQVRAKGDSPLKLAVWIEPL